MANSPLRWMVCLGIVMVVGSLVQAAPPRPMTDTQLDAVYAAGFDIRIDLDLDLAATNPDAVIVTGEGVGALQQWLNEGMTLCQTGGSSRNAGSFDPTGTYMPEYQNLVENTINITDNALQNATSLLNVFALQGDIAIGVNLNVIVNPINSTFNVTQNNLNWVTLGLSDTFQTFTPSISN